MNASLHATNPVRILPLLAACALAGCAAVGPDFHPETPASPADYGAWHAGAADLTPPSLPPGAPPMDWAMFGDPVLDKLEARARSANADLRTAALRFAQSRSQRSVTAAQGGPQVNARASATRIRTSEVGEATRLIDVIDPPSKEDLIKALSQPYDYYDAGFDASWELDLWGRVRRSVEAADANVATSRALLAQTQLSIQAEVARHYFELRGTQRRIVLARRDIAAAQDSLKLMQARADGGLTTDLDVTRQAALAADLRARLPQLLAQEAAALNQITLLVGERPGALNAELAAVADAADPTLPDLSLGLPSEVALRRPDIQRAQAALHAATANTGVAVADLYPRITIGANFGFGSVGASDFGEWGSRQWSIGPTLQLPIFDQGRRRATITLRELQQQEAAVAYQQTVLKAWHEIDDALSAYGAERARNRELIVREAQSRDALLLARTRYEHGLTDFLVQLDAERTLLQAQRDRVDSTSRLALGLVAVSKAIAVDVRSN